MGKMSALSDLREIAEAEEYEVSSAWLGEDGEHYAEVEADGVAFILRGADIEDVLSDRGRASDEVSEVALSIVDFLSGRL